MLTSLKYQIMSTQLNRKFVIIYNHEIQLEKEIEERSKL